VSSEEPYPARAYRTRHDAKQTEERERQRTEQDMPRRSETPEFRGLRLQFRQLTGHGVHHCTNILQMKISYPSQSKAEMQSSTTPMIVAETVSAFRSV
jgi:hypothetical protein